MAKTATATTKTDTAPTASENAALATPTPSALVGTDVLGGLDLGGTTGLEETDASDFRLASITLNFSKKIGDDVPPKSAWVNTVTEEVSKDKTVVLLVLHKSRAWSEFVQGEGTKRHCSSWDMKTGTMENGTQRPCEGCPDAQWRTENGKRSRRCGEIHNVVALERATGDLVMIRAKKTGLDPWKTFLNKFFLGKRVVDGKRTNVPLFAFETKLSAETQESKSGTYAVPVFDLVRDANGRPNVLAPEELRYFAETARGVRELYLDRVREVADGDDAHSDAGAADTSFEYGANAGDRFADPNKADSKAIETETRFG